jgi:hypothetical protein
MIHAFPRAVAQKKTPAGSPRRAARRIAPDAAGSDVEAEADDA